jgi:proline dehydrogenase
MSKLSNILGRYTKAPVRAMVRRAARAYVAGDCLDDALTFSGGLSLRGIRATLGYWDAVGDPPDEVYAAYCAAIDGLGREKRDTYLSIKFPSLGFSADFLERLILRAKGAGVRLHFDSLAPDTVDRTWSVIQNAVRDGEKKGRSSVSEEGQTADDCPAKKNCVPFYDLGCTLPARWKRSPDDAQWAADYGLAVRVVKGQWPDPNAPKHDPRRGFASVIERLAGRARTVAVATHDLATARYAIERLQRAGTPATLELLYGLPTHRQIRLARELGVGVRIYIPYGAAYLPYCLAQLKRRPWQAWWLVRDAFSKSLRRAAAL